MRRRLTIVNLFTLVFCCLFIVLLLPEKPSSAATKASPTHHMGSWYVEREATCQKNGEKRRNCTDSYCGYYETESIPKTSHSMNSWHTTKNATCGDWGVEQRECKNCTYSENRQISPTNKHSFGGWSQTVKPGCTTNGSESRMCSVCHMTETRNVACRGYHVYGNYITTVNASCTQKGSRYKKCNDCPNTVTEEIPQLDHVWGSWGGSTADCEHAGTETRSCSLGCGTVERRSVAALGHYVTGVVKTVPATCEEEGKKGVVCNRCGKFTGQTTVIPKLEHDWKLDSANSTSANCGKDGVKVYKCNLCGKKKSTIEKATGYHTYNGVRKTVEATDGQDGYKALICSVCGLEAPNPEVIHYFNGKMKVVKAPTCCAAGDSVEVCSNCGAESSHHETIAKLSHEFGAWTLSTEDSTPTYNVYYRYCKNQDCKEKEVKKEKITGNTAPVPEEEITYTVVYDYGYPEAAKRTVTLKYGDKLEIPSRDGYVFKYWKGTVEGKSVTYTAEDINSMSGGLTAYKGMTITLYAHWEEVETALTYTVVYDYNYDNKKKTVTMYEYDKLEIPYREGYTFLYWFGYKKGTLVTYSLDTILNMSGPLTEEKGLQINLTAFWQKNEEKTVPEVTPTEKEEQKDDEKGDIITPIITEPENPEKEIPEEKESKILYDLYYDLNNGSNDFSFPLYAEVLPGGTVTIPNEKPTRTGYNFLGWSEEKNSNGKASKKNRYYQPGDTFVVNHVTTLHAQWEPIQYTIILYDEDGKTELLKETRTIDSVSLFFTRKEGYRLSELSIKEVPGVKLVADNIWSYDFKLTINNRSITQISDFRSLVEVAYKKGIEIPNTLTFTSKWELDSRKYYEITFMERDSEIQRVPVKIGDSYTIPSLKYNGNTIKEWSLTKNGSKAYKKNDSITPCGNVTLYAAWKYKYITYDDNGGTGGPGKVKTPININVSISNVKPEKKGKHFIGWSYYPEGNRKHKVDIKAGGTIKYKDNMTLYAVWETLTYNIEYQYGNYDWWKSEAETNISWGDLVELPSSNKEGFTIKQWLQVGTGNRYKPGSKVINLGSRHNETVKLVADIKLDRSNYYYVTLMVDNTVKDIIAVSRKKPDYTVPLYTVKSETFNFWYIKNDGARKIYTAGDNITLDSDIVLISLSNNSIMLEFNNVGGNGGPGMLVADDDGVITILEIEPHLDYYTFLGWSYERNYPGVGTPDLLVGDEFVPEYRHQTVYAVWKKNSCNVVFEVQGRINSEILTCDNLDCFTGIFPSANIVKKPSVQGYIFDGWELKDGKKYKSVTDSEINSCLLNQLIRNTESTVEFRAVMQPYCSVISYYSEDGSVCYGKDIGDSDNNKVVLWGSSPEKGYILKKWRININNESISINPGTEFGLSGNIDAYAKLEPIKYSLTVDYGTPDIADYKKKNIKYDSSTSFMTEVNGSLNRVGYLFDHWEITVNGQTVNLTKKEMEKQATTLTDIDGADVKAKAVWKRDSGYALVTLVDNGKTISEEMVLKGEYYRFTNYTVNFKSIDGWSKKAGGKRDFKVNGTVQVLSDMTFYAYWQ